MPRSLPARTAACLRRPWGLSWVAAWVLLTIALGSLVGCDEFRRRKRRFGATCGQDAECETGLCFQGHCTRPCTTGSDCTDSGVCIENKCQAADGDFDNDGLLNAYEAKWSMKAQAPDSDGDGLADDVEVGSNLDKPLDHNGDGLPDAVQSNTSDQDGDCLVDAYDKVPGQKDALPSPADLCNSGVCAGSLAQVTVQCAPVTTPVLSTPLLGCLGCTCQAPGLAGWQPVEDWCDQLDNDCDGTSDEGLAYQGATIGQTCEGNLGVCALDPKPGLVECGTDKTITCSTNGNGSQPSGSPEVCNGLDDDCDGSTDDGFTFQGKAIGQPCPECGFSPASCPTGEPLNPPVVSCSADGSQAVCGGVPFPSGFKPLSAGTPGARRQWTATYSPAWKRLVVYGGRAPTAAGQVDRADVWQLDFTSYPNPSASSLPWQQQSDLATPGPRSEGALAWDEGGGRMLLIGGRNAVGAVASVWSLDDKGQWQEVSASSAGTSGYVPPLPVPDQAAQVPGTQAVVLQDSDRALVAFDPAASKARFVILDEGSDWTALSGDATATTGAITCLARSPDGSFALALRPDGTLVRLTLQSKAVMAEVVSGLSPTGLPVTLAQCTLESSGTLHVFGGLRSDQTPAGHFTASFLGGAKTGTLLSFSATTDGAEVGQALARAGGFAVWMPHLQQFLVGGGLQWSGVPLRGQARPDVWFWDPSAEAERVDPPLPGPRIGHASGWWPQQKKLCLAGGLRFDVPASPIQPGVVVSEPDAWCFGQDGWALLANAKLPFAFGLSGIDAKGQRLVAAGGLKVTASTTFSDVGRLWEGRLLSAGKLDAAYHAVDTVQTLDLATGATQTVATSGAPHLAAAGQAWDPKRNRLISYGGFGVVAESAAFFALDLATLAWTDLGSKVTSQMPQPRVSPLVFYDPYRDLLGVLAGSIRAFDAKGLPTGLAYDTSSPPPGAPNVNLDPCYGIPYSPLWVGRTLGQPGFTIGPVPNFANLQSNPPSGPLTGVFPGGPAFVPVLFDALGGKAWVAIADPPAWSVQDGQGQPCAKSTVPQWSATSVQVHLDAGACLGPQGPLPTAVLATGKLDPVPGTMLLSTGLYVDATRQSWVWGGMRPDGTLSNAAWRMDQVCKAP